MTNLDLKNSQTELSFRDNAYALLPTVVEALYSHPVPTKSNSDIDAQLLHELRIEAKRLRYLLEFFESCYGKRLERYLEAIRLLQEILGNIHDCDVMVEFLTAQYSKLDKRGGSDIVKQGLNQLIADFQRQRTQLACEFLIFWQRRFRRGFKTQLLKLLRQLPNTMPSV
ncbi:MAG: CHAD domain-containing protein [Acidobacteriota bacterium]